MFSGVSAFFLLKLARIVHITLTGIRLQHGINNFMLRLTARKMDTSFMFAVISALLCIVEMKKDPELNCAVCRAVVDEVNYIISQVNPNEKIQVGSFRVDSKGDQKTYKVPLGRSEVFLTEVFETICEKFKEYGSTTNSLGKKSVLRMQSRDGGGISLSDVSISADVQQKLKFYCENMLEDYEDEIMTAFRKGGEDTEAKICQEITEFCTDEDLSIEMPKPSPVPKDIKEDDNDDDDDDDDEDEDENDNDETGSETKEQEESKKEEL